MRYLPFVVAAAAATARAQPAAVAAPACPTVDSTAPGAGLGPTAGIFTLTLVSDSGRRSVGTLFLRPPDEASRTDEGYRVGDVGTVTVSLAPFGGALRPAAPPGLPAWPLRLLAAEYRVADAGTASGRAPRRSAPRPPRVMTVLGAVDTPRLAPGQVATGYDVFVLRVDEIAPGRLRGRWRSPMLGWRTGHFCAAQR